MNIHSISLKGLRDQNEDTHNIITNANGKNANLKNVNFFSIFDGHGGKEVSAYLRDNLYNHFLDKACEYPLRKTQVNTIYDNIQKALKATPYASYTGSTALVIIMFRYNKSSYLNILNLGDCRCVIGRDNIALPLTKDHKPSWPEEQRRIENLGGKIVFDGYDWRIKDLSVSRAFGDTDANPFVTWRPELFRYKLERNDKFIIMACDGLWDVLSNQDAVNFVLMNSYDRTLKIRNKTNNNIAKKLAEYALKKGSTDNVSIIIIFLD